jgi:hypothetical protein
MKLYCQMTHDACAATISAVGQRYYCLRPGPFVMKVWPGFMMSTHAGVEVPRCGIILSGADYYPTPLRG